MTGDPTYDRILVAALCLAGVVALVAPFVQSGYGRFAPSKWDPKITPRLGWFLMELPATVFFWIFFLAGPHRSAPAAIVLAIVWQIHYLNRGFIFPYLIRPRPEARSGLSVVGIGAAVTAVHGYLNGAFISTYGAHIWDGWLTDPRFLVGIAIYYAGFFLNVHSDAIVRGLRSKDEALSGERAYRIPRGGGFRYVTNPSYLGELIGWIGWSIATWSLAGVFILAISAANLVPRAFATHKWYLEKFPDYPKDRKVLVPFVV